MKSMSLFSFFVEYFDINTIYELGWYAASQWMVLIAGILTALAIGVRIAEEKINLISTGRSRYTELVVTTLLIICAIGLYFTLVDITIRFFNAIYGALDSSSALVKLTHRLDEILDVVLSKEYSFSWRDLSNSMFMLFATVLYVMTYGILIFVIVTMRIAHALLVSFCVFWGAVALPLAIAISFRQLSAWKNLCWLALIWPIVDALFVYLIGGSFSLMLDKTELELLDVKTWSMSVLLFYMATFCLINLFLIAAVISAPIVTNSLVSGSGNISGMVLSFGAACMVATARSINLSSQTTGKVAKPAYQFGQNTVKQYFKRKLGINSKTNSLSIKNKRPSKTQSTPRASQVKQANAKPTRDRSSAATMAAQSMASQNKHNINK